MNALPVRARSPTLKRDADDLQPRGELGLTEIRPSLGVFNDFVDTHGIPLARCRQFDGAV